MVPGIVACAGEGQQEEEPKETAFAFFFRRYRAVGRFGSPVLESGSHPVPTGAIRSERVFIGRPPKQIIDVGVL